MSALSMLLLPSLPTPCINPTYEEIHSLSVLFQRDPTVRVVRSLNFLTSRLTAKLANTNCNIISGHESEATREERAEWKSLMPCPIIQMAPNTSIANLIKFEWGGNVIVLKKAGAHLKDCTPEDIVPAIESIKSSSLLTHTSLMANMNATRVDRRRSSTHSPLPLQRTKSAPALGRFFYLTGSTYYTAVEVMQLDVRIDL
ncbi:hypothetical protein FB451DRAFT_1186587 [Mycena latifolia]|nr:hypothetical protein FB451DRAFT_1186587 [Mycena latifolia]